MHVRRLAASGLLLATCGLATGVTASSAQAATCDAYSGTCTGPTGGGGGESTDDDGGATINGGTSGAANGATLPFTGGELVLLTAVGAGALAGGTALVVAGRRKSSPAA